MTRGHKGRTDGNHTEVAKALLAIGCSVQSIAAVGLGCPDLLAAKWDVTVLFEVKDGSKPASERALTKHEKKFHEGWKGLCFVVESGEQAVRIMREAVRRYEP